MAIRSSVVCIFLLLLSYVSANGVIFLDQVNTIEPSKAVYLMKVRVSNDQIAVDTLQDTGNGLGLQANGRPHVFINGDEDVTFKAIEDNVRISAYDRLEGDAREITFTGYDGVNFNANNDAGGDLTISSGFDTVANAGTDVEITGEENIYATAQNEVYIASTERNVVITAGTDVDINGNNNIYVNAHTGDIEMNADQRDVEIVGQNNVKIFANTQDITFCAVQRDVNMIAKKNFRIVTKSSGQGGIAIFTGRELGNWNPVETPQAYDGNIRVASAAPGGGITVTSAPHNNPPYSDNIGVVTDIDIPATTPNAIQVHAVQLDSTNHTAAVQGGILTYTENESLTSPRDAPAGSVQFMTFATNGGIDLRSGVQLDNRDAQNNNIVLQSAEGSVLFSSAGNKNMPTIDDAGQHILVHAAPTGDGSVGGGIDIWTSTPANSLANTQPGFDARYAPEGTILVNAREANGYIQFGIGALQPEPVVTHTKWDYSIMLHATKANDDVTPIRPDGTGILIGTGGNEVTCPIVTEYDAVIFRAADTDGGVVFSTGDTVPTSTADSVIFYTPEDTDGVGGTSIGGGIYVVTGNIPQASTKVHAGSIVFNTLGQNTAANSVGGMLLGTGFFNEVTVGPDDLFVVGLGHTGGVTMATTYDGLSAQRYSILFQFNPSPTDGGISLASGRNTNADFANVGPFNNDIVIVTDVSTDDNTNINGAVWNGGIYVATGQLSTNPLNAVSKDIILNAFARSTSRDRDTVGGVAWGAGNCIPDAASDNDINLSVSESAGAMTVWVGTSVQLDPPGLGDLTTTRQQGNYLIYNPTATGGIVFNTGDLAPLSPLPNDDPSNNDIWLRASWGGGVCIGTGTKFSGDCASTNDITINTAPGDILCTFGTDCPGIQVITGDFAGNNLNGLNSLVYSSGRIIFNAQLQPVTTGVGATKLSSGIALYTGSPMNDDIIQGSIYVGANTDGHVLVGTGDLSSFKGTEGDVYVAATNQDAGVVLATGPIAAPFKQADNIIVRSYSDGDSINVNTGSIGFSTGFAANTLNNIFGKSNIGIIAAGSGVSSNVGQVAITTGQYNPRTDSQLDGFIHVHAGTHNDNDAGGILATTVPLGSLGASSIKDATPYDVIFAVPGSSSVSGFSTVGGISILDIGTCASSTVCDTASTSAIDPLASLLRIQSVAESLGGIAMGTGLLGLANRGEILLQSELGATYVLAGAAGELNRVSHDDLQIQTTTPNGGGIVFDAEPRTTQGNSPSNSPSAASAPQDPQSNSIQFHAPGAAAGANQPNSGAVFHVGTVNVPAQQNNIVLLSSVGNVNIVSAAKHATQTGVTAESLIWFDSRQACRVQLPNNGVNKFCIQTLDENFPPAWTLNSGSTSSGTTFQQYNIPTNPFNNIAGFIGPRATPGKGYFTADIIEWDSSSSTVVSARSYNNLLDTAQWDQEVSVLAQNTVNIFGVGHVNILANLNDINVLSLEGGVSVSSANSVQRDPDVGDTVFSSDGQLVANPTNLYQAQADDNMLAHAAYGIQLFAGANPVTNLNPTSSLSPFSTVGGTHIYAKNFVDVHGDTVEVTARGTSPVFPTALPGYVEVAAISAASNSKAAIIVEASSTPYIKNALNTVASGDMIFYADTNVAATSAKGIHVSTTGTGSAGNTVCYPNCNNNGYAGIAVHANTLFYVGATTASVPSSNSPDFYAQADNDIRVEADTYALFQTTDFAAGPPLIDTPQITLWSHTGGAQFAASTTLPEDVLPNQVQFISDRLTDIKGGVQVNYDSTQGDLIFIGENGALITDVVCSVSLGAVCPGSLYGAPVSNAVAGSSYFRAISNVVATSQGGGISERAADQVLIHAATKGVLFSATQKPYVDGACSDSFVQSLCNSQIRLQADRDVNINSELGVFISGPSAGLISFTGSTLLAASSLPQRDPDASDVLIAADASFDSTSDGSITWTTTGGPNGANIKLQTRHGFLGLSNSATALTRSDFGLGVSTDTYVYAEAFNGNLRIEGQNGVSFNALDADFISTTVTSSTSAAQGGVFQTNAGGVSNFRASNGVLSLQVGSVTPGGTPYTQPGFVAQGYGDEGDITVNGGGSIFIAPPCPPGTPTCAVGNPGDPGDDVILTTSQGGQWIIGTNTATFKNGLRVIGGKTILQGNVFANPTFGPTLNGFGLVTSVGSFVRLGSVGNQQTITGTLTVGTAGAPNDFKLDQAVTIAGNTLIKTGSFTVYDTSEFKNPTSFTDNTILIGDVVGEDQIHFGGTQVDFPIYPVGSPTPYQTLFRTKVSLRNVDQQSTRNLVSLRIDTLTLSGDGSGLNMDQGNLILTGNTFTAVATGINFKYAFVNARSAALDQQDLQPTNRGDREPAAAFDAANGGIFVGGVSATSSANAPASRVVIPSVGVFGSNSTNFMEDIIPLPYRGGIVRHALISVNHASRGGGGGLVASEVEKQDGTNPNNAISFFANQGSVRMEYGYVYIGGGVSLAAANGVTSTVNIGSPISPTPPNDDALSEAISLTAINININPGAPGNPAQIDMMPHTANGVGGIVLPYIAPNGQRAAGQLPIGNIMCVNAGGVVGVCRQGGNEFASTGLCANDCACNDATGTGLCSGQPAVGNRSNVPGWPANANPFAYSVNDPCNCQPTH